MEQNPEFPGGMPALGQYLGRNLRYPSEARKKHTSGLVFVQFVVSTDGTIQSPRILKGIGNGCDEEAVRIVSQMPRWNPGLQSGVPVKVQFTLPIRFALEGNTGKSVVIGDTDSVSGRKPSMTDRPLNVQYHVPLQLSLEDIKDKTVIGNGGEKPLIVIDGKEQDLNTINPDNIQSMNVLKGSSAQATYGDKGKNGVIEITTKAKKP
ncbi:MAG: TonB family protein [Bacteroidetes bacterium]|nr:TonB family protein [Fibrella sp.]